MLFFVREAGRARSLSLCFPFVASLDSCSYDAMHPSLISRATDAEGASRQFPASTWKELRDSCSILVARRTGMRRWICSVLREADAADFQQERGSTDCKRLSATGSGSYGSLTGVSISTGK